MDLCELVQQSLMNGMSPEGWQHLKYAMMTSSNGSIFRVTGPSCTDEFARSPGTDEFPTQRPVTRSFDEFFYMRLNKPLSKQSWGWSFETPSRPLWRHCNGIQRYKTTHNRVCYVSQKTILYSKPRITDLCICREGIVLRNIAWNWTRIYRRKVSKCYGKGWVGLAESR